jgi:hypothetical protein
MIASDFHNLYGDSLKLDILADFVSIDDLSHLNPIDNIKGRLTGGKTVYILDGIPTEWNLDTNLKWRAPIYTVMSLGNYFPPHRDFKRDGIDNDMIRLNCFITNAQPEECTYIIDNTIQKFNKLRWYVVNPRKTHYSFSFKDNTIHYIVDLDISDKYTFDWVFKNIMHQGYK